jgi:hypothetical protein
MEDPVRERAEEALRHWEGVAAGHRAEAQKAEANVKMLRQIIGSKPKALVKDPTEPGTGESAAETQVPDLSDKTLRESAVAVLSVHKKLPLMDLRDKIVAGGWSGSKKNLKASLASALSTDINNSSTPIFKRVEPGVYTLA